MPLLVVLHGDIDHAATTAAPWIPAITARGWGLLAIECPVAEGCDKGSFWRWNGPPAWLTAQVDKVRATYAIDGRRVFLSGWSGGASYIGWHAPALAERFAAIVIHGGGVAPPARLCTKRETPVYFLVGDQNPLHHLAKELRGYFETCGHDVTWDLLPHAGHAGELAALDLAKASTILDLLEARTAPAPPSTSPSSAPSVAASVAPDASSVAQAAPKGPAGRAPMDRPHAVPAAHGCSSSGTSSSAGTRTALLSAFAFAFAFALRRRRRTALEPSHGPAASPAYRCGVRGVCDPVPERVSAMRVH